MGQFLDFADVDSETIRLVHRYWSGLRGTRRYPAKRDIDPAGLKPMLPYIMIAEVHRDPLRVRYRLVGTEVVHFMGEDFTGKWLHETAWGDYVGSVEEKYALVFKIGGPVFGIDYFTQATSASPMNGPSSPWPRTARLSTIACWWRIIGSSTGSRRRSADAAPQHAFQRSGRHHHGVLAGSRAPPRRARASA